MDGGGPVRGGDGSCGTIALMDGESLDGGGDVGGGDGGSG